VSRGAAGSHPAAAVLIGVSRTWPEISWPLRAGGAEGLVTRDPTSATTSIEPGCDANVETSVGRGGVYQAHGGYAGPNGWRLISRLPLIGRQRRAGLGALTGPEARSIRTPCRGHEVLKPELVTSGYTTVEGHRELSSYPNHWHSAGYAKRQSLVDSGTLVAMTLPCQRLEALRRVDGDRSSGRPPTPHPEPSSSLLSHPHVDRLVDPKAAVLPAMKRSPVG